MADTQRIHPNLASALVAARAEFAPIKKTHTAKVATAKGSYEYRFATLDEINDATQPALQRHGLAVVQKLSSPDAATIGITTLLLFGAEALDCGTLVMPTGGTPQSIGSACTYGRRYGLTAALNVAAEDDDDGQTAQHATTKPAPAPARPTAPPVRQPGDEPDDPFGDLDTPASAAPAADTDPREARLRAPADGSPTISEGRQKRLFAIAKSKGWTNEDIKTLLRRYGFEHSKDIPNAKYDDIVSLFEEGV